MGYNEDIQNYPIFLPYVKQTEAKCIAMLKGKGDMLDLVKKPTYPIIVSAINSNGMNIRHVDFVKLQQSFTHNTLLCAKALICDPSIEKYIPEQYLGPAQRLVFNYTHYPFSRDALVMKGSYAWDMVYGWN